MTETKTYEERRKLAEAQGWRAEKYIEHSGLKAWRVIAPDGSVYSDGIIRVDEQVRADDLNIGYVIAPIDLVRPIAVKLGIYVQYHGDIGGRLDRKD